MLTGSSSTDQSREIESFSRPWPVFSQRNTNLLLMRKFINLKILTERDFICTVPTLNDCVAVVMTCLPLPGQLKDSTSSLTCCSLLETLSLSKTPATSWQ